MLPRRRRRAKSPRSFAIVWVTRGWSPTSRRRCLTTPTTNPLLRRSAAMLFAKNISASASLRLLLLRRPTPLLRPMGSLQGSAQGPAALAQRQGVSYLRSRNPFLRSPSCQSTRWARRLHQSARALLESCRCPRSHACPRCRPWVALAGAERLTFRGHALVAVSRRRRRRQDRQMPSLASVLSRVVSAVALGR